MTKLHDLFAQGGQSPWLDNLRRDWLHDGRLADLVGQGIRGLTSNPTILAKAIEDGPAPAAPNAELTPTPVVPIVAEVAAPVTGTTNV